MQRKSIFGRSVGISLHCGLFLRKKGLLRNAEYGIISKNQKEKVIFMGKFVVKSTATGLKFDLKAANGETIATSEVYTSEAACLNGVESVRKNAAAANLEDQTAEDFEKVTHPKFEVYQDKAGEYRFRLKARNGEIIAVSEGYKAKAGCLNGVESVRKNAPEAELVKE